MKLYPIICLIFCMAASGASGAVVDDEGMPVVYFRGNFNNTGWKPSEDYRFQRVGNTYTLEIGAGNALPDCEFKIADEEWNFDFGGSDSHIYIDSSTTLMMTHAGKNLYTNGIYSATISFDYKTGDALEVNFDIRATSPGTEHFLSGSLPVMYINVFTDESHSTFNDEVTDYNLSHKDYFNEAEYWLDLNGCEWMEAEGAKSIGSEDNPLPLQIKARGNFTRWGFSKKPFKLKLDKKQDLLGLSPKKSKHYALLAHADDTYSYLRNFTAFNLGNRIGLPWTPGMQPLELVINGDYRGLYFLTESIRVEEGRIEIESLDDNATEPALISGGYVVELDNYDEENQIRMEEKSWVDAGHLDRLRITWDTPEEYSPLQVRFITDQFTAMNNAVGSNDNALWSYIDLDDAARYYLVNEIVSHTESYHGSTYLYRDRGENQKWHFSPLWDAGNAFSGRTNQFFYDCDPFGNTWIPSMRANDMFNSKVKDTWLWFMQNEFPGIEEDMEDFALKLKAAALSDRLRWKDVPAPKDGWSVADNTDISSGLDAARQHIRKKVEWLKGKFGDFTAGHHDEPMRDTTAAAPLPEYAMAGIHDLESDSNEYEPEYYNLQGIRVANPRKGEIYIIKQGNVSRKVMIR